MPVSVSASAIPGMRILLSNVPWTWGSCVPVLQYGETHTGCSDRKLQLCSELYLKLPMAILLQFGTDQHKRDRIALQMPFAHVNMYQAETNT